jgi:hypothetical protein
VCQEAVQYGTSAVQTKYKRERVQSKEWLQTGRILQEKGLLRRIQEPEYSTEKITSLVYVV